MIIETSITKAVDFYLPGIDGNEYSLDNFVDSKILVIFFTCNHCPYVIGSDPYTKKLALEYSDSSVTFIGINSNSDQIKPEDSFNHMISRASSLELPWVYLRDEDQSVAISYNARKTPEFFVFDESRSLVYHGAGLDDPRNPESAQSFYLADALYQLKQGQKPLIDHSAAIGCTIKWKPEVQSTVDACDLKVQ